MIGGAELDIGVRLFSSVKAGSVTAAISSLRVVVGEACVRFVLG
jgi:hypothetical protein